MKEGIKMEKYKREQNWHNKRTVLGKNTRRKRKRYLQ